MLKKLNTVSIPRSVIEEILINHVATLDKTAGKTDVHVEWEDSTGAKVWWVEEIGSEGNSNDPAVDLLMEEIKMRNGGTEQFWPGGAREGVRS